MSIWTPGLRFLAKDEGSNGQLGQFTRGIDDRDGLVGPLHHETGHAPAIVGDRQPVAVFRGDRLRRLERAFEDLSPVEPRPDAVERRTDPAPLPADGMADSARTPAPCGHAIVWHAAVGRGTML